MYWRSLLFVFGQAISAVVICPLALACLWMSSMRRARLIAWWARFNIWSLKYLCRLTYRVTGLENLINVHRPAVLMANHQSAWETLCFQLIFPPQSYILKKRLLWIPFFGWGLAANRPIAIDRAKKMRALEQLVQQGGVRLAEGRWVVAFPEGTRRRPGQLGRFQSGGAMLAVQTGAPVVPVAHNAGVFWPRNQLRKHCGVIDVHIGAPIDPRGKTARAVTALAEQWIAETAQNLAQSCEVVDDSKVDGEQGGDK